MVAGVQFASWRNRTTVIATVALALLAGPWCSIVLAGDEQPLRFGVVGFYTPRLMFEKYQPFMDYLSRHTGRVWELAINTDYQTAIDDLCSGSVSVCYLGPLSYVRAREQCGVEPVLQLMTRGLSTYRSSILVRDDSPIHTLAELEGRSFGFGARLSTSSHLIPRSMLVDAGVDLDEVTCAYYENHDRVVRAVLIGEVEACGVRDLTDERFLHRGLRVLVQSPSIPNHPLAVAPNAVDQIVPLLERALIDLPATDPVVAAELKALDDELSAGFERSDDSLFEPIRQLADRVFGSESLSLPVEDLGCDGEGR